ncbi:hypothetical protein GFS24_20695 [Chitinophaga sp. SYP-B3965]|uniref:hypothetical protein n=1 Tax=Chitinophaga sp. SYP-B3965 TaxID=2663120 RepID=UPI0012996524|nr:hypothetical protein [Chitinophaga sp. SYP-B3965]MRG47553.1 hypothetical protein [Chitinophaga sp. SYP-B3965]
MPKYAFLFLFVLAGLPVFAQSNALEVLHGRPLKIEEVTNYYHVPYFYEDLIKKTKTFGTDGMLQLVEETQHDHDDKATIRTAYVNDTLRKLILSLTTERWDKYGYTKKTSDFSYDEKGFRTQVTERNEKGDTVSYYHYLNNEKGDPIESRYTDHKGSLYSMRKITYNYDSNTMISAGYFGEKEAFTGEQQFRLLNFHMSSVHSDEVRNEVYNEKGDPIKYSIHSHHKWMYYFEAEYEYDEKGNWTSRKVYQLYTKRGKQKRMVSEHSVRKYTY